MLLHRIDAHLRAHRMTPTKFGREALGDPNLVAQLRQGRQLRTATVKRILNYLAASEKVG